MKSGGNSHSESDDDDCFGRGIDPVDYTEDLASEGNMPELRATTGPITGILADGTAISDNANPPRQQPNASVASSIREMALRERELFQSASFLSVGFPTQRFILRTFPYFPEEVRVGLLASIEQYEGMARGIIQDIVSTYCPSPDTAETDEAIIEAAVNCLDWFAATVPQSARDGVVSQYEAPTAAQIRGLSIMAASHRQTTEPEEGGEGIDTVGNDEGASGPKRHAK